jgi:hypothetical protein
LPPRTISGKKLLITDGRSASKRKIVFVSKDPALDTSAGGRIDPVHAGAFFQVFGAGGTGDSACFDLPAARWVAKGKGFKYEDAKFANSACKMALVKDGKLLTVVCLAKRHPIDYSLNETAQASVGVRFGSGTTQYCAVFGGTVKDLPNKKFKGKNAPAPAACPLRPASCP